LGFAKDRCLKAALDEPEQKRRQITIDYEKAVKEFRDSEKGPVKRLKGSKT